MLKLLAGLLGLAIAGYAAICALMYFQQRSLVYFGGATRVPAADTDFALERPDGVVLRGWVANRDAPDVLLFFGGNAEQVGRMREPLQRWLPGRASYLVAYRGYGASGGEPSQERIFEDALALYDDVAARHRGARVAVVGRSLGSGVAAYVAGHRPVDRLVLVTPYDSLANVAGLHYPWLPTGWLVTERFESTHWLRDWRGPTLVLRGGRDAVVPPASTDALLTALRVTPQVVATADAGHDQVLSSPEEIAAFVRFFDDPAPASL